MLGESVVVVGAGGVPLHRPRSADNLSRLTPASSVPALDDLAESEVFVGDEEEEMEGMETYLRHSLPPLDPCPPGELTPPDLLSPPCPLPSTSLVIAYHEEALRLPLDAVKEEVEAEALEEASMILSSGPASLGHASLGPCSLTSSMVSSASLEDSTLSSRTDTFDTVVAAVSVFSPSPPHPPSATSPPPRATSSRPGNKDAARVAGTPARTSPTSPRGSSGRSSPRTATDSPSTPEKRRGAAGTSPRGEGGSTSSSRGSTPRGTPRMTAASSRAEDKRTPRGTARSIVGAGGDRRQCTRAQEARQDTHSHAHAHTKTREKSDETRSSSTLGRKKKPEAEARLSSAPARKETRPGKETTAPAPTDKYGSLGRRRRGLKEALGETKEGNGSLSKEGGALTRDNKQTLDMYATLPRRRAREMSARWKEQMAAEEEATRPSLRRTKSVGKSEAAASSTTSRNRTTLMTTSLPPSALRPRSPRTNNPPARSTSTSTSNLATRKEKTIICMEAATQTALTGLDVASALRAMSRQNSIGAEESDEAPEVTRPHVAIVREEPSPEELPPSRSVEVQVELAWRLGEGELPEHVRRLTEEHTRLQNEHSRARVRLEEMESLREELQRVTAALEEERAEKEEVQSELDRTSQRVKDMLISMEGVEHEFNSRGDSLMELESQLHHSADIHMQMQDRLNKFEECNLKIKRDLDKSVAAQKILLQQVQDLENEGREMADFMAEEKNALAECLKEAESEVMRLRNECHQMSVKLKEKEDEVRRVARVAEDRRNKYMQLQSEISSIHCRTRDMMVCQGAEVSGAAVSLNNVSSRLRALIAKLVQDYSISEADLEMIVTPSESDSSASSTNGTPEHKPGIKVAVRRTPSPRKTASFMTALLSAMRMGPKPRIGDIGGAFSSLTNGASKEQVTEGRNSPEGSESHEVVEGSSVSSSLTDQVTEMDVLLTHFLKVCCVLKNESDLQMADTEDENERLSTQVRSQQQVIDQQHADYEALTRSEARARKELAAVQRELDVANKNLTKYYEAEYDHQVMKLQLEVERLGGTVRHLEALNEEKERQLEEALSRLSAAQESAPANHVSEASHYREVSSLSDKVTSLRQSVMDREKQIIELNDRHGKDLASLREAQGQAQRSATCLTSTVDHVLKTLESIPDVVSSCPALKQLFNTMAATEKSTQQQQKQNGNINSQNGFANNTVNNTDLNANPQPIISPTLNNKRLITNQSAEIHL